MKPITGWSAAESAEFGGRVVLVVAVFYSWLWLGSSGVTELFGDATVFWVVKLLLDVSVLGYVAVRSRWGGTKLGVVLLLVYGGLQIVSFTELYLYGFQPAGETLSGAAWSLVNGAVLAVFIIVAFGRGRGAAHPVPDGRLRFSPVQWAWKLPVLGVAFTLLFLGAGLFVFQPVARLVDPQALAGYEILEPPWWIVPFQALRGLAFTALLLPVIYLLRGGLGETRLTVAVLLAVLLSSGLLIPTTDVPGLLWVAHVAEVGSSSFVYGWVLTTLVHHPHHPIRRVLGRRSSASDAPERGPHSEP